MNKLVYISGPYSASTRLGVEANINEARKAAVWCAENRIFYFCPHLNTAHFEEWSPETPVSFYYAMDEEILSRCDAMLVLPGWSKSKGASAEVHYCLENKLPFFEKREALLSWHREEQV